MKSLREIAISSGSAELVQALDLGEQLDRLGGRLGEVRARVDDQLLAVHAGGERQRDALAQEREHLADDVPVEIRVLQAFAGRARVCITTSAAPVCAHSSASAGSRRPLTSLTILAPAAIAARATGGL